MTITNREARVLLVDDDRELCQMLTEYLDAEHFEVKSVHDGAEALDERTSRVNWTGWSARSKGSTRSSARS